MSNGPAFWLALFSFLSTIGIAIIGLLTLRYKAGESYVKGLESRVTETERQNIACHTELGEVKANTAEMRVKFAKMEAMFAQSKESSKEAAETAQKNTEVVVGALKETAQDAVQKLSEATPKPKENPNG